MTRGLQYSAYLYETSSTLAFILNAGTGQRKILNRTYRNDIPVQNEKAAVYEAVVDASEVQHRSACLEKRVQRQSQMLLQAKDSGGHNAGLCFHRSELGGLMRAYNERRNRQVWILVERRKLMPKQVAVKLGLSVWNVYQIIHRSRSVKVCQTKQIVLNSKVA